MEYNGLRCPYNRIVSGTGGGVLFSAGRGGAYGASGKEEVEQSANDSFRLAFFFLLII
jgi:hypothetical protein